MKNLIRILSLVLCLCLLAGCGAKPADDASDALANQIPTGEVEADMPGFNPPSIKDTEESTLPDDVDASSVPVETLPLLYTDVVANDFTPVRYVMIYNPDIYDPNSFYNSTLNTGSIGTQVEVDMNRGGLTTLPENLTISQDELYEGLDQIGRLEGDRASGFAPVYSVGDTHVFYGCDASNINARVARSFTCRYTGTYCNIWVADVKLSDKLVQEYGMEFDSYVYESVVGAFGPARFTDNGGKVNLLFYDLPSNIGGFFHTYDLFASNEVMPSDITYYGLNTDQAILHINGNFADYNVYPQLKTYMKSTLAHEFQHLICASNAFETVNFTFCDSWINEAMSGYIEELLYPGVKEDSSGHLSAFLWSDMVRNGQSLYNFATGYNDIGVYGSVYLYSTYLAQLAGDDVFSNFHRYWRSSYSDTLSVPEALANSVPMDTYYAVDASITFPKSVVFESEYEAWMSKLTLQFYLDLLDKETTDPASFNAVSGMDLLYNEINPAFIEGGGRIIIALSGDSYQIPKDADDGLVYIGLDKDFNVVTALIAG